MPVPFIDLKRFEPDFLERWTAVADEVTRNTMFVGGPKAAQLEQQLAEKTGAKAVVGCANGTDALQLALRASGVNPGDTVLIPDATFWATFEAVCNVGAHPVTVDIDMSDLQLDYDLFVEAAEKHRPRAAILVHLYGWCTARLQDFRNYCKENDILLIEDGAQCFGVGSNGESLYAGAHIATTSFYPAKVFGSCGDAGAVFCSSEELADRVRLFGNHGRISHYEHGVVGWNSRMGGFDAAWLLLTLDYIDARIEDRIKTSEWWRAELADLGINIVGPPEGVRENGYLAVTLHDPERRPAVGEKLKELGVGFGTVYPGAMSKQPGAEGWIKDHVGGDNAHVLGTGIINPPLFAYMTEEEKAESLNAMKEAVATPVS